MFGLLFASRSKINGGKVDDLGFILEAAHGIRSRLERNPQLDELDRLRLENCMSLLQMSYIEWKRRNIAPNPPYWGSSFHERNPQDNSSSCDS